MKFEYVNMAVIALGNMFIDFWLDKTIQSISIFFESFNN